MKINNKSKEPKYCHCEECIPQDLSTLDIALDEYELNYGDDGYFLDDAYKILESLAAILRILDGTD
jgi:hypothetical protein